ncbi:MAG: hypothetical protein IKP69_08455, partial [Oscillospiraceae bacterium]|nr:hypothetical protein [Oscillospiraceae bacterium]
YSSEVMTSNPKNAGDFKAVFTAIISGTTYTLEKEFTINKANIDMSGVSFNNTALTYNGQSQNLLGKQSATLPLGGKEFKYAVIDLSDMPTPAAPIDENAWKDTPKATKAGVYMVYCKAIGNANYNDSAPKAALAEAKINKANPTVTPPTTKNPTYSSSAVQLIDAGIVPEGCTMYYAVSNIKPAFDADGWESDATKITANSAGTYKVWYKVTGSDNYNDVAVNYIPVTVTTSQSTSTPGVSTRSNQRWTISLPSYIYDGTAHEVEIIGDIYGKIIYYYYNADTDELLDGAPSEVGNYRVRVYAGGNSSYNSRSQSVEYAITNPIDKNGMANVGEFKTNNAIPTVKGKIFAGYFTDSTCTTPYTKDSGKAYAKFIDEKILTVKAQISSKTTADSASTSIRFITSVDSLKYQNVGFKITYNGKTIDKQTATVYTVLLANGKKVYPSVFSADSHYMEAYALNNIPNNAFGKEFTVTPYYTTQDGTIVDGKTNTFTIANMIKN